MNEVLFVLVRLPHDEVYGGEKSTIATAHALARRGYRPRFLLTARDGLARELDAEGLPYDVVPVGDPINGFRSASWRERARRLADMVRVSRAIARIHSDGVLIVHAAAVPGVLCSWLGARLARGRLIYHSRGGSRLVRTRLLDEVTMLLADHTITVSRSLRDELVGTGHRVLRPLLARRVTPVYNGFDFARMDAFLAERSREDCRREVGPDPARVAAVFVGGIYYDKGHLRFIERVLPEVARQVPEVLVTCIGGVMDPAYRAACEEAIRRLGLADHIRFLGYRPQRAVYAHYRASDLAVAPSEHEGLPRCVIEEEAFGLPVVGTAVVGTIEAVEDGKTGFLVANDRVEEMAGKIVALARDAALRRRLGDEAARHVRAKFSLERNAEEIDALYRSIAR
jgi:glycosyltransferase involved in cell wall biosynthesis